MIFVVLSLYVVLLIASSLTPQRCVVCYLQERYRHALR
jgi:hypothetical protein